jgi:hypothetical protein
VAARDAVRPEDIVGEQLIGVPADKSPALRAVTDAGERQGWFGCLLVRWSITTAAEIGAENEGEEA